MKNLIVGAAILGLASVASAADRNSYNGDKARLMRLADELEVTAKSVHRSAEQTARTTTKS